MPQLFPVKRENLALGIGLEGVNKKWTWGCQAKVDVHISFKI